MNDANSHRITEQELNILEDQVEGLIRACTHLKEENRILRGHQETLQQERAELMEKNNMAKTRVDAIITRLKSLEAHT
jgi:cell division protein ZapB